MHSLLCHCCTLPCISVPSRAKHHETHAITLVTFSEQVVLPNKDKERCIRFCLGLFQPRLQLPDGMLVGRMQAFWLMPAEKGVYNSYETLIHSRHRIGIELIQKGVGRGYRERIGDEKQENMKSAAPLCTCQKWSLHAPPCEFTWLTNHK